MQRQELSSDQIREFVLAGHGNLRRVQELLEKYPDLLNATYRRDENDTETAIQAAAQVGNVPTAEFLLSRGAPLSICTAAMLGREHEVKEALDPQTPEQPWLLERMEFLCFLTPSRVVISN